MCFDPVLGELRNRYEPVASVRAVKVCGNTLAADAGSAVDIPSATTSRYGVTRLNNSTNSASQTEAATPSAVRAAYQLADYANYSAAKTDEANWFYRQNVFYDNVLFSTSPRLKRNGKCYLTLFNESGLESGHISTSVNLYDPETGEEDMLDETFSEYAVRNVLVAKGYQASDSSAYFTSGYNDVYVNLDLGGSAIPFMVASYDEDSGSYAMSPWRDLRIGYANPVHEYSAGYDGSWNQYWFEIVMVDDQTGDEVGQLAAMVAWNITPGQGIDVHLEIYPSFTFHDSASGQELVVVAAEGFPTSLDASTIPSSPYYDYQYEYESETGWEASENTPVATMDDCASAVTAAIGEHNGDGAAHQGLLATSKLWNLKSTSDGGRSETLTVSDRSVSFCQNSMNAGGDTTLNLRLPARIEGRGCEFYVFRYQTGWSCTLAKPADVKVYPVDGQDAFGAKGIGLHVWHFVEFKWNPKNQSNPRCFFIEYKLLDRSQNS